MSHNPHPSLNYANPTDQHTVLSLLSLPNETLDQIVRVLAGEPTLGLRSTGTSFTGRNHTLSIGLVNKRLRSIAAQYTYFRHKITSERELQLEANSSTEDEQIRRKYTKQLVVDGAPILYWLNTIHTIYPSVTHLTLTKTRISLPFSEEPIVPELPTIRHLSVQASAYNEAGLPHLLRSFPNILSLVLDSDTNTYKMDTKVLLSFPPLPKLQVLYRPPLKHTYLSFTSFQPYSRVHEHNASHYDPSCRGCVSWCQRTNSSEACSVSELAWHFPSLREVFIPRLVIEDLTVIQGRPSKPALKPRRNEPENRLGWIEFARQQPDVAIWLIEEHPNPEPVSDHTFEVVMEPANTVELSCLDADVSERKGHLKRLPFKVLQPLQAIRNSRHRRPSLSHYIDYPKFWWSSLEDRIAGCTRVEVSAYTSATSSDGNSVEESNPRVLSPWDL